MRIGQTTMQLKFIMESPLAWLVPQFDDIVPAGGEHFRCLMWMPQCTDAHIFVCLKGGQQFGGLPVPEEQFAICIARYQIANNGKRKVNLKILDSHLPHVG